jgi:hypothetical protein
MGATMSCTRSAVLRTCMSRVLSPLTGGMSLLMQLISRTLSLTMGRVRRSTDSQTRHRYTCRQAAHTNIHRMSAS